MSELLQFVEYGFLDGDTEWWLSGSASVVPASNRRRILDRDTSVARPDGWVYDTRHVGDGCVSVTRLRWDDRRLYDNQALPRALAGWTRTETHNADQ